MSSKVTTIYDNLGTLVAAQLSTYTRIPNPYLVTHNNQLLLTKGYGIAIGPGQYVPLYTGCKTGRSRQFELILINQMAPTDHDITGRENAEKALVEDFLAVELAIESDNTLSGQCIKVDYQDDSGIEFLANDKLRFVKLNATFLVTYQENLP